MPQNTSIKPRKAASRTAVPVSDSAVFTRYVGKVEVRPRQQARISLGVFDKNNSPKGFCVNLSPEPQDDGTVVSHVSAPQGRMEMYELTLQITNYGLEKIDAEVWQMQ